ncbi:hypothetical protein NKR19_g5138 [Coniochaeta hoffmannii]|uniref:Uncharacterized protein n=1 Tax=Coniochaeta hoffmannii TaxID=91930 RepID=A0AA38S7R7_9PEZI|nr:hypothetical protein NKR19_g5138 [Coniochaeta hoffmannii]
MPPSKREGSTTNAAPAQTKEVQARRPARRNDEDEEDDNDNDEDEDEEEEGGEKPEKTKKPECDGGETCLC